MTQLVIEGLFAREIAILVGTLMLCALLIQAGIEAFRALGRLSFAREHRRLTRARLQLQIKTAAVLCRQAETQKSHWNGWRKFEVVKKQLECENMYSFYLTPHDRKRLPAFKPGQYLTFQLQVPGQDKPLVRCYSLSDSPGRGERYRVTIKKIVPPPDAPDAPPGRASSFMCDQVAEGDILDAKAPGGHFFLNLNRERAVVLIGGGVGVTPVMSMLNVILESESERETHFFLGVRNRAEHMQKEYLERVAAEHKNVHLHVCYSRPGAKDAKGVDYHYSERVSVALFQRVLPSSNYDFYMCGPAAMMESLAEDLKEWGVPESSIFYEAFGPASVKKVAPAPAPAPAAGTPALQVTFNKSKKVCRWEPSLASGVSSLLDLAEAEGIKVESGCRAGNCGTCLVAIKSGAVEYLTGSGTAAEEGSCLTCIAKPKSDLVLDA